MLFNLANFNVLIGLAALAVPIVLHLLQRRRVETLDWGAMQFLPESVTSQKRRWLDEWLLLALRLAIIAAIVLAFAAPYSGSPWLAALDERPTRDVVLVIDASASMGLRLPDQPTPWDDAVRTARHLVQQADAGDRFAIVLAKQPADLASVEFSGDLAERLTALPPPRANPDMPRALAQAWKLLQTRSQAERKEIVVLTDRQQVGWADLDTLAALDHLGIEWRSDLEQAKSTGRSTPTLRVIAVGPTLPKSLPNYALGPLTTPRRVARVGQKVTFQSALHLDGFDQFVPPKSVTATIDGKSPQAIALPEKIELKQGQIPLRFEQRFDKAGRYTVALRVDAAADFDVLPADNERELSIEVVEQLPVLVVDGERRLSSESSGFFAQRALQSAAVPVGELKSLGSAAVVVLADVPRLESQQIELLDTFIADGGGLLIAVGSRAARDRAFYNEQLFRGGQGWLPAKLLDIGTVKDGVQPEPSTMQHPALELFRTGDSGLGQLRFPRWWRTKPEWNDRAEVLATFSNGDPWLIEKPYKKGRVILCTTPLDRGWDSPFPSTWEFPIFLNELAYYLAGSRASTAAPPLDLRESKLDRCSDEEWRKVRDRLPVSWHDDSANSSAFDDGDGRHELWWLLLAGVIAFLCGEVWMTRRLAQGRG